MKNTILLFALCMLTFSCSQIQEPVVQSIANVDVKTLNKNTLHATADMVISNPNSFALDLASADLVAIVDEIEMATITQTYDTEMPAKSDFNMPIEIKMDFKKLYENDPLGALGKGLQILGKRELEILFKGDIKVGKGSAKVAVPVEQVELVKF